MPSSWRSLLFQRGKKCLSCEETTFERTSVPSLTTAAPVSSHDDSIPRISTFYPFEIIEIAMRKASISFSVLKYPGLTLTAPSGYVRDVLCASGAQWVPHLTIMENLLSSLAPTSWGSLPSMLKDTRDTLWPGLAAPSTLTFPVSLSPSDRK